MSLFAPLAVVVEVRAETRGEAVRAIRLSTHVAESGISLQRPAPFEIGQPVIVTFALPDSTTIPTLTVRAVVALGDDDGEGEAGGSDLVFVDPTSEARQTIARYVAGRLGLPGAVPSR